MVNEGAEAMLRRLIEEDDAKSENARYILAIMLERKKTFRQADIQEKNGARMLFYEHTKSGEAFIVRDPNLQLSEIDAVQQEVALWQQSFVLRQLGASVHRAELIALEGGAMVSIGKLRRRLFREARADFCK